MGPISSPQVRQSMAELRVQLDAIDAELVNMLVLRSRYIDRAAELKRTEGLPARTTDRVAEVLEPVLVRALWTELIERSIERETKKLAA